MRVFIKQNWFKIIIAGAILVVALSAGYYFISNSGTSTRTASNGDTLLDQQKCAEQAAKFFSENGNPSEDINQYQQVNHYNTKLNKCFMLITPTAASYQSKTFISSVLVDAFEGKEYALVGLIQGKVFDCVTQEQLTSHGDCASEAEFESYVKPYMEN